MTIEINEGIPTKYTFSGDNAGGFIRCHISSGEQPSVSMGIYQAKPHLETTISAWHFISGEMAKTNLLEFAQYLRLCADKIDEIFKGESL